MITILKNTLIKDIKKLGLPTDFELLLKKGSSRYYGRYFPDDRRIFIYTFDKDTGIVYDYYHLLEQLTHEAIHHYQWVHSPSWERRKGIMHDLEFKRLLSKYMLEINILREGREKHCKQREGKIQQRH